jgi:ABC-type sugar transport system permease subunit
LSLAAVLVSDIYDLAAGTSRAFANNMAMIVTGLIALIALLQLLYAQAMKKREVLS